MFEERFFSTRYSGWSRWNVVRSCDCDGFLKHWDLLSVIKGEILTELCSESAAFVTIGYMATSREILHTESEMHYRSRLRRSLLHPV